jgi:hypothetical protein
MVHAVHTCRWPGAGYPAGAVMYVWPVSDSGGHPLARCRPLPVEVLPFPSGETTRSLPARPISRTLRARPCVMGFPLRRMHGRRRHTTCAPATVVPCVCVLVVVVSSPSGRLPITSPAHDDMLFSLDHLVFDRWISCTLGRTVHHRCGAVAFLAVRAHQLRPPSRATSRS